MSSTLAEILKGHLTTRRWSFERLAKEAEVHRNTVYRWISVEVRRVHRWQDLVRIARTLELDKAQADALLEAGGHASIEKLAHRATDEDDRALLSRWTATTPNNLPSQLTSFVGRQEELERLTSLLSSARLVTLTGPGGSGKTRLALEVAQAVLDEFEGVYVIDLASVRDPELVIPTISQTLDLGESLDEPPLRALATYLRDRNVLLVLDNFEQVVEAAPPLANLLGATQWVKTLVTSRTRLNVRGERELAVPPLPLPSAASGIDELTLNPAVALFADRARVVDPAFTLSPHNAQLVAELCARLDGLPLGIELAAARTRQVGLCSMLERFPGRLALASRGPRDMHDRQRTLRATIAWSYDLLGREEQTLFNCLGVFAGGFTEEAADSVCGAIGRLEIEVSEGLEPLVEQNLLRRAWTADDEPRYEMLETIHEYALERLKGCEKAAASEAAAAYYLDLVERAELEGGGQAHWLHRLMAEHANFRAALGWCRERGQRETGLRLSLALMPMWQLRDHLLEARAWLEEFMVAEGEVSSGLRAKGLLWRGLLLLRGPGDDVTASRLFAEALVLFRDGGDLNGTSEALQAEGDVYRHQGEFKRANQRYAESLELAQQTSNAYLVAHGWMGLAFCAQEEQGQFEAAQRYWELTLEWAERARNGATVALTLNSLGEMARYRGDWEEAERYYEQALSLARELGNEFRIALALHNLGYVALYSGNPERAGRLFTDGLSLYEGRQYHKGVAECLAGLGKVEASEGRLERAARLCGAVDAILEGLGTRLDTVDRADYERTLATLRSRLGERLETLLDEGSAMSMDKAVEYAGTDRCTKSQGC